MGTRRAGNLHAVRYGGRTIRVQLIAPRSGGGWTADNLETGRRIGIRAGCKLFPWSDPEWVMLIDPLTKEEFRLSVWWDPCVASYEVIYPHQWARHVRPCEVPSLRTAKNVAIAAWEKGGNDAK